MRFGKPSPAMVVAVVAVVVAMAGTAFAATGQLVNIADPTVASRLAKVDSSGKLYTGDGSGAMTVDGTTTEAAPNTAFRSAGGVTSFCVPLATPPAGRALIIKSVALNTLSVQSPGPGRYAGLHVGTNGCESWVMDINPPGTGLINQPFEPGVPVPAGKRLWVIGEDISAQIFAFGYTVPSSAVPASSAAASAKARSRQG